MQPYYKKLIIGSETPASIFKKIVKKNEYAFLLESAESQEKFGRYSFLGFNPKKILIFKNTENVDPLKKMEREYRKIRYRKSDKLPLFQAGFVGYFTYEIVRHFEKIKIPLAKRKIPEGIFFLPKNMIVFDHKMQEIILIAYTKNDMQKLEKTFTESLKMKSQETIEIKKTRFPNEKKAVINQKKSEKKFYTMIESAKEKIKTGEIFQIVLSQKFEQKTTKEPFEIYENMRRNSPSPYMYYMQYPDFSIIGSSPETLIRTEENKIILRPIAGTRRRGKDEEEEKKFEEELKNDPKEQAEHMMLLDLGRNDIGKIAKPGSVRIEKMMQIEKYSHVMHMTSEIHGEKDAKTSLFQIFRSTFPAGTLTGTPKIRAMEMIGKLEKEPREIYGGALGYFDFSGNMDFAIIIRTMLYRKNTITLQSGAGIVYDSIPKREFQECMNKAKGPLTTI